MPVVGREEIGDLAHALEVFREQALEIQRLNLVEKPYCELQEANAELQRVQDRLVAQEKLAALGGWSPELPTRSATPRTLSRTLPKYRWKCTRSWRKSLAPTGIL